MLLCCNLSVRCISTATVTENACKPKFPFVSGKCTTTQELMSSVAFAVVPATVSRPCSVPCHDCSSLCNHDRNYFASVCHPEIFVRGTRPHWCPSPAPAQVLLFSVLSVSYETKEGGYVHYEIALLSCYRFLCGTCRTIRNYTNMDGKGPHSL
jgi:hypothetical protein